ncbi:MAG: ATP-binding protein, partial [Proteobacteria bacterium]|nr:ATP-binding protein [Pseudomonadota bacterium]
VLRNLMSNAIKFSFEGKEITIRCKEIRDRNGFSQQKISVINIGIGIPEDELASIFEKFIQSSATKSGAGGTGLGLAICSQILDDHNSKIWAENSQEGETSFHFLLPVSEEQLLTTKRKLEEFSAEIT